MGRAKFISFLGTSRYVPCSYYFSDPDEKYFLTAYVQVSILRRLVLDEKLRNGDEFVVLMTESARGKNWDGEGQEHGWETLKSALGRLRDELTKDGMVFPEVRNVIIPEGKSEEELWRIFEILVGQIDDGDRVYLDITHSFRSLPALVLVAINYLRVVKHIELRGIYYGAFEVLGSVREVNELQEGERRAPIFDLTAFANLFEWTSAANQFVNTGNALMMAKLARRGVRPILREGGPEKEKAKLIENLGKSLEKFSRDLFTVQGPNLPKDAVMVKQDLEIAKEDAEGVPSLAPLMDLLIKEFEGIKNSGDFIQTTNLLVEYCFRHELIQQGFTLLFENVTTLACKILGADWKKTEERKAVNSALGIIAKDLREEKWRSPDMGEATEREKVVYAKAMSMKDKLTKLVRIKNDIGEYRHRLNHAAFNNPGTQYDHFLKRGREYLKEFEKVCEELDKL